MESVKFRSKKIATTPREKRPGEETKVERAREGENWLHLHSTGGR